MSKLITCLMIPKNIAREHILKAIEEAERSGIPKERGSDKYDLEYNKKIYPPKYIISLANKYANGKELDHSEFAGGNKANNFLEPLGFNIVNKQNDVNGDEFEEHNILSDSYKDVQYFLLQVSRSGSEELLSKCYYEHTNWHDTPRDHQHGMVKGGDILLVYFADQSIKYKMQLKKVYRVDSVSENNLRFNLSEQRELNGISLNQIKNAIKSGRLRKEVFEKVSQQGFNIAKIEKYDFDEVILLDREILSANIQSCFKSFPDSKDKKFIENARQIHREFLSHFPFDRHPEIIDTLKTEDIYQLGNKDSFLNWLQYKTDTLGGVGFRSGEYRQNVLQNLGLFKQLLKIVVDPNRTLDQKIDVSNRLYNKAYR